MAIETLADAKTAEYGVDVAKILNRFSEEELGQLVVQLTRLSPRRRCRGSRRRRATGSTTTG